MTRALTVDRLRSLLAYDPQTGVFTKASSHHCGHRWGIPAGHVEKNGYRRIMVDGERILAHRLAWFFVHGSWPEMDMDHINGQPDDNRIANLRPCTPKQNTANCSPTNPTGLKGAVWNRFRGHWQSYIKIDGRSKYLGRFATPEAAHEAFMNVARSVHGAFARGVR